MRSFHRYLTKALVLSLLSSPLLCYSSEKKYTKEEVVLFCSQTCPPCQKVLEYLRQIDRAVTIRNVSESEENLEALLQIGGKAKVPCLAVDHKTIYESTSIINWLSEHKEGLPTHRGRPHKEETTVVAAPSPVNEEPSAHLPQPIRTKSRVKEVQDKYRSAFNEKLKMEEKKAEEKKKKK